MTPHQLLEAFRREIEETPQVVFDTQSSHAILGLLRFAEEQLRRADREAHLNHILLDLAERKL